MIQKCKYGHVYNVENTHWYKNKNGKMYKQCRKCHAKQEKLRYRNNEEYRERSKVQAKNRYYARTQLDAQTKDLGAASYMTAP
jgi:hypothetical protein